MSHISRSTLIIAFFFGIDKIFGLARQVLVAREFGLSYELDAFNAANNIPDLLSALISGGALGVALIPVLSEYLQKRGRSDAWDLFSRILNLAFLVTGVFALLIAIFARPMITFLIAPGFPAEQQDLAVSLMRLDLIGIMIFSISGLVMAGLQANQHFLTPALAPLLYNIGQIFGVLVLAPTAGFSLGPVELPGYGFGVFGLVYGVILGAALHLAIQIPALVRFEYRWHFRIGVRSEGVRRVLRLLGPRVLTMLFIQWFFIFRDNLASGLGEGSVTALNYGWFIMQVPETLIGTALAIAILPTLAEYFAQEDLTAFRATINRAVKSLIALTIPSALILSAGVRPLVAILGFDAAGIDLVVLATRVYLIGLAGHALLEIASRSFYARQDALTPLFAAFFNAVLYTVLAVGLLRLMGFAGIALANSIAFTIEAILLFVLLRRKVSGIWNLGRLPIRVALAGILGGGVVLAGQVILPFESWGVIAGAAVGAALMIGGGVLALPWVWPEIRTLSRI